MGRRGKIYNPSRASQPRDFSGLRYAGNITPTDIDCISEFGDEAYYIVEAKSNGQEVPHGQRLALQRMIRDFVLRGKAAVLIVATHNIPPPEPIPFDKCKVIEHFNGRTWSREFRGWTVKHFIDWWLKQQGLERYIP